MQRLKLQLSLYCQPSNLDDSDDGSPGPDELDLHSGYRRPKVDHLLQDDYVKTRLKIARLRAIEKYREIWG
jgi:hypothetical protein